MKKALPLLLTAILAACGGDSDDTTVAASQPESSSPAPSSTPTPAIPVTPAAAPASPSTPSSATLPAAESAFLSELVQSGTATVQQAQAALQRTNDAQVRQFAQVLIDNHTQLNNTLTQLAQANSVALSANTNATTGNTTPGTGATPSANPAGATSNLDLDRLFLQQALQQQRQYVSRFQAQAAGATNIQLKSFAANALPLLQLQLLTAKELGASIDPAAYLQGAYEDGLGEIALGNLALQKSQDERVRAFAQMMVTHHTEMNARIATLAQSEGVTLPQAAALPVEHAAVRDSIAQMSGADFNKAYMSHNVVVHLGDVNATRAQSTVGTDAEVRAFAAQSLPMLETHLQEATAIYTGIQPSTLVAAFQNNISEILLSSLATPQRATSEAVRRYAQHMIEDHATQNTAVAQLAAQENIILPNVLPAEGVVAYRTLLPTTGDDFNRAFMAENIRLHEAAVALFTERTASEPDPEQRQFAASALPVLRTHLQEATQLNASLTPAATPPAATPPAATPPAANTPAAGATDSGAADTGATGTGATGTGATGTGATGTGTTGTGTTGTGTTGTGTTGTGTTGTGTTGTGTTGTGTTGTGTIGTGTTGTGTTGTGTTGTGTTGTGTGTTGAGATGTTPGTGTVGAGSPVTGTTGTGTGTTGTATPLTGTPGTGTTATAI